MRKVALITGSTQGIGAGMARYFAQHEYDIVLNAPTQALADDAGKAVVKEIEAFGVDAICVPANVVDTQQCKMLTATALEKFGKIDVLINNAGITKDGLLVRMKEEDFDAVINVNLKGVYNMCRQVAPLMMKARSGNIINMSSVAGVFGNAGQVNYSASKAGVVGITKSIAKELGGRGIICNAIAPGFIQSPMTDVLSDEIKEKILANISLGRLGNNEDIAKTAMFLAQTSYITGQVIVVDGGLFM